MSFWPQKEGVLWWYGQTDKQTNTKIDIADSWLNWPHGQFGEKLYFLIPKPWVYWQLCLLSFVFCLLVTFWILQPDRIFINLIFSVGHQLLWQKVVPYLLSKKNSLLHTPVKCSLDKVLFLKSNLPRGNFQRYIGEHFWENALLVSQKCSPIFFGKMLSWQNALVLKSILSGEHFAKEYGRAFLREQKSILAK